MACTCFSQDNVTCDHQRKNADDWTIELTDDSDDIVVELPDTKNQDTFVVELSDDDDPMAAVMRASRACSHDDDDWSITITDDAQDDDTITIDDSVLQELATEVKGKTCPKGRYSMRAFGEPVSRCSAKPNQCPLRDGSRATGKDIYDDRIAAVLAAGRAKSAYYNDMYARSREQDRQWDMLRQLHKIVKPRPMGQRQTVDFGIGVPSELRFLTY